MKLPVVLVGLTLVTGAMQAQTSPATTKPTDPQAATATTNTTVTPPTTTTVKPGAKPDAKTKVDPKKKPAEVMGTIKGITIPRANGTYLGLEVVSNNFVLTFYDKKKKPMAMDVTRATARWPNLRGPGDNRTVLNGSGTKLTGAKPVVPPYTFNVYLTLLQGEGDDAKAVENYVVQFRG